MKLQEQIIRIQEMMNLNESKLLKQFQNEIDRTGFIPFMRQSGLSLKKIAEVLKTTPSQLFEEYIYNKELSTKDFNVNTGTYEFTFRVDDFAGLKSSTNLFGKVFESKTVEMYVSIIGGEVTIDDETYDLIESDLHETDAWLEVQYEIKDILEVIIKPFIPDNKELELTHDLEDID